MKCITGYNHKRGWRCRANMEEMTKEKEIEALEKEIEALPVGYISKKNIHGKIRYYRQWTESGKIKSQYIKEEELEEIQEQIARRKELQQRLKELTQKLRVQNGQENEKRQTQQSRKKSLR